MEHHELHAVFDVNYIIEVRELLQVVAMLQREGRLGRVFLCEIHKENPHREICDVRPELLFVDEEHDLMFFLGFRCCIHVAIVAAVV